MIYNKFSYKKFEEEFLQKISEFLEKNDVSKFENGRYDIDKDNLFLNIATYNTTTPENRVWEAHKEYIDVHMMIKGKEKMCTAFIENANITEYHEDSDYVEISDIKGDISQIILNEGEYLVCYPQDVHKTACIVEKEEEVKKAIFKVRV
jgi:YhcH/YjgK/YiaL family protein